MARPLALSRYDVDFCDDVGLRVHAAEIRATADAPDPTQLWQPPDDLEQRDLFHGAGGPSLMPDRSEVFEFVAEDRSGYSAGYEVRDSEGVTWSVKVGRKRSPKRSSASSCRTRMR